MIHNIRYVEIVESESSFAWDDTFVDKNSDARRRTVYFYFSSLGQTVKASVVEFPTIWTFALILETNVRAAALVSILAVDCLDNLDSKEEKYKILEHYIGIFKTFSGTKLSIIINNLSSVLICICLLYTV